MSASITRRDQALPSSVVGGLGLSFEDETVRHAVLTMAVHTAEPGSPSHNALNLLASWAATLDPAETANVVNGL